MKRVIVTGASGFVGAYLARRLLAYVLHRDPEVVREVDKLSLDQILVAKEDHTVGQDGPVDRSYR